VSVLVIDCTTTGAPPPTGTLSTQICRFEATWPCYCGNSAQKASPPLTGRRERR
jgi:hypothetical protein